MSPRSLLSFEDARASVIAQVRGAAHVPRVEGVALLDAVGRVLAEEIEADRDYPPFPRSARDGYAVRSADQRPERQVIGEIRAGSVFEREVGWGEAVEIMTGAPLPEGADAVVMVENTARSGDQVRIDAAPQAGDNFSPRGIEAKAGEILLHSGQRVTFAGIAALAMVGRERVSVFERPAVAILATGDEIVELGSSPGDFEIRNSNAYSLAAQVTRAGGIPEILPVARDQMDSTRAMIERGLDSDLLLLSGGVSMGKYDIVEQALAELGAQFYFDGALIQPGKPVVFGEVAGKFFFGLPGNPLSTMVTFEIFARAAVEILGGASDCSLPLVRIPIARDFTHKPGLTRFLPARMKPDGGEVDPLRWQGSADIPTLARGNVFVVADRNRESWKKGDLIQVLLV